jgi:8-oxo-dGTP pyrophosphatase MutT (NUDIX family)
MTTDTPNPSAVVSAIIEKIEDGTRFIFMQTRWKPQASPTYLGVLEIPAGGIDGYENAYDAVKREVREETGTVEMQTSEAKDPRWVSIDELDEILRTTPEKIFSLQLQRCDITLIK